VIVSLWKPKLVELLNRIFKEKLEEDLLQVKWKLTTEEKVALLSEKINQITTTLDEPVVRRTYIPLLNMTFSEVAASSSEMYDSIQYFGLDIGDLLGKLDSTLSNTNEIPHAAREKQKAWSEELNALIEESDQNIALPPYLQNMIALGAPEREIPHTPFVSLLYVKYLLEYQEQLRAEYARLTTSDAEVSNPSALTSSISILRDESDHEDGMPSLHTFEEDQEYCFHKEAAKFLGVAPQTLYQWRNKGIISCTKHGKYNLYKIADLIALKASTQDTTNYDATQAQIEKMRQNLRR